MNLFLSIWKCYLLVTSAIDVYNRAIKKNTFCRPIRKQVFNRLIRKLNFLGTIDVMLFDLPIGKLKYL